MTAAQSLALLKAHFAKKGFDDIEVNMTGGYDPTSTPADSAVIRAATAVYKKNGIDPVILPRLAGSWPVDEAGTDEDGPLLTGRDGAGLEQLTTRAAMANAIP